LPIVNRPFPIDTALYLTAPEFVRTEPEAKPSPMTTWWPVFGREVWVEHQLLMPLLYTGAIWSLTVQGRLQLSLRDDGEVDASQIELTDDVAHRLVADRIAGLRPDSYDSEVMLGFSQRPRNDRRAADPPTVTELAGWGRIHQRTGVERYRLAPHDELAHRMALLTPSEWTGTGIGAAWKKFKRRAKSRDYEPKPRADEVEVDGAKLAAIAPLVDEQIEQFRTWQSAEPDLATAVFEACSEAMANPSPYKGITLDAT
jgi:hypothetical protein